VVSVPTNTKIPTSIKRRSYLQAQLKKAALDVSEVKDLILTSFAVTSWNIITIQGEHKI